MTDHPMLTPNVKAYLRARAGTAIRLATMMNDPQTRESASAAAEILEATVPQIDLTDTANMRYVIPVGLKTQLTYEVAQAIQHARMAGMVDGAAKAREEDRVEAEANVHLDEFTRNATAAWFRKHQHLIRAAVHSYAHTTRGEQSTFERMPTPAAEDAEAKDILVGECYARLRQCARILHDIDRFIYNDMPQE